MTALANCGRWREAVELIRAMRAQQEASSSSGRPAVSLQCYTAAIAACGKAGRWKEALRLWTEILSASSHLRADVRCVTKVLNACAHAGQWRAALRVLEYLRTAGLEPARAPARGENEQRGDIEGGGDGKARSGGGGELNRLINRACMLHDSLTRSGALDGAISFEAAIYACEIWGVGEELIAILESLGDENVRTLSEAGFLPSAGGAASGAMASAAAKPVPVPAAEATKAESEEQQAGAPDIGGPDADLDPTRDA